VPDEPLDFLPNQALIVQVEAVRGPVEAMEESVLNWLTVNAIESPTVPTDLADQHDHYLYGCPTKDVPE